MNSSMSNQINTTLPGALECQYSYKPCTNPRTTKRNGKLHLLCEYHRKKANAIQQAYTNKKRAQKLGLLKRIEDEVAQVAVPTIKTEPQSINLDDFINDLFYEDNWNNCSLSDLTMTQEEYMILNALF
ncbi:hypothetical protein THRCLA_21832 [Thraustotheca clavata]|uniref:Uncharacterized protein n=1 Tax=Thraustotheca clavata TaxID=74557 RepID=A0A1V9ZNB0_9STRA|nr:hypothetical protein THRCLA_21832 [Thraustotheca clavata]